MRVSKTAQFLVAIVAGTLLTSMTARGQTNIYADDDASANANGASWTTAQMTTGDLGGNEGPKFANEDENSKVAHADYIFAMQFGPQTYRAFYDFAQEAGFRSILIHFRRWVNLDWDSVRVDGGRRFWTSERAFRDAIREGKRRGFYLGMHCMIASAEKTSSWGKAEDPRLLRDKDGRLVSVGSTYLIDYNSNLPDKIAANAAELYHEYGFDWVYFDGCARCSPVLQGRHNSCYAISPRLFHAHVARLGGRVKLAQASCLIRPLLGELIGRQGQRDYHLDKNPFDYEVKRCLSVPVPAGVVRDLGWLNVAQMHPSLSDMEYLVDTAQRHRAVIGLQGRAEDFLAWPQRKEITALLRKRQAQRGLKGVRTRPASGMQNSAEER